MQSWDQTTTHVELQSLRRSAGWQNAFSVPNGGLARADKTFSCLFVCWFWKIFKQFAKQPAAQEVLQQPADLVEGLELEAEPVAAVVDVELLLDNLD